MTFILPKLATSQRPHVMYLIKNKDTRGIHTSSGRNMRKVEVKTRAAKRQNHVFIITTPHRADTALKVIKSKLGADRYVARVS